jgi:hypothetical protein
MKQRALLAAVCFLFLLGTASGQTGTVLTNFDHAVRDGLFSTAPSGSQIWDAWTWGNPVTTMWDTSGGAQFEGEGALKIDWFNLATPGWGWYGNLWFHWTDAYGNPGGTYFDLSTRDTLKLRYKVLSATSDSVRHFKLILFLYDGSELGVGGDPRGEPWISRADVRLDVVTPEWQTVSIPLVDLGEVPEDSTVGRGFMWDPNPDIYGPRNKQLDFHKIMGFRIDISTSTWDDIGDCGGSILFDLWEATGNISRPIDTAPPEPTAGLAVNATPGVDFSNTLSWSMTTEPFGLYDAFYSNRPITDLSDPLLDILGSGLETTVTELDHALFAPNVDQDVTYYYNVVTYDRSRNRGTLPASVSRTAPAKGIPTINDGAPAGFFADGDLTDWAGIGPTLVYKEFGSEVGGATGAVVDDSTDLSGKAYLAADNTYLYVAFDVVDDLVYFGNTDRYDSPELFIGLYDSHGRSHSGYERGSEPDYYMRFEQDSALLGYYESWNVIAPYVLYTGEDYLFTPKAPPASGYIVEARLRWDSLASKVGDNLFVPQEGMKVPLGIGINDRDTSADREGALYHGKEGNWQSPMNWKFTWIGDQMYVTSVPGEEGLPGSFELQQNYPNPFNPRTQIVYDLPRTLPVKLTVYDILGRSVAQLVNGMQGAGRHVAEFDATRFASGTYIYRLQAGGFTDTKKMMILK